MYVLSLFQEIWQKQKPKADYVAHQSCMLEASASRALYTFIITSTCICNCRRYLQCFDDNLQASSGFQTKITLVCFDGTLQVALPLWIRRPKHEDAKRVQSKLPTNTKHSACVFGCLSLLLVILQNVKDQINDFFWTFCSKICILRLKFQQSVFDLVFGY